jgi:hypothetical protein
MWRFGVMAAVLLVSGAGCTTILGPGGSGETSRAGEPPASWESAILFQFRDSLSDLQARFAVRVELGGDAARPRTITGRDVYLTESNFLRTPWYRLRTTNAESSQVVIRLKLDDASGGRTEVEYPLPVKRDEFYYVLFGVASREPEEPHRPSLIQGLRRYAVPAEARRQPSDSLWIGYYTKGRYCFTCPG